MIELSIVIPALNEEKTIGVCIKKALKSMASMEIRGEVVVADNGSTDSTVRIADREGARVISVAKKGYGSALLKGLGGAKGKFLIMADADDSYNFEEIASFVVKLREGYDLVVGNRFKGRIEKGAMPWLHRHLGTPVLTAVMNLFFKTKVGDVNCGMRGLTKDAFRRMRLRATGMEFAQEMIIKASLIHLKICEVSCNLYRDKRDRKPHLNTWQDGWRHLRFALLFAPAHTFFVPGGILCVSGLSGMLFLTARDIFSPRFAAFIDSKHMVSMLIVFLTGTYIVALGTAARAFGYSRYFDSESKVVRFLKKDFSLEKGLGIGFVSIGIGIVIFAYLWVSFYLLNDSLLSDAVRFDTAIFGALFVLFGIQLLFTSFLLSLFQLKVK